MKLPDTTAALSIWRAEHRQAVQPRASVGDHPNGSLTAAEALRIGLFGPGNGSFGPAVTDSSALQVGTVFACLSKLGGAVSQLPLHEYRERPERVQVTPASPLWWLLNEAPEPSWTASAWKQWIVRCVKMRGDQHTEILRRGADVVGFRVHHPDAVVAARVNGRLRYACRHPDTQEIYGVEQDDMLHFTGFGFDGVASMSAIKWAARNAIATELGAAKYIGKTITEGGMPRVALEYPASLSPHDAAALRETRRHESQSWRRPASACRSRWWWSSLQCCLQVLACCPLTPKRRCASAWRCSPAPTGRCRSSTTTG